MSTASHRYFRWEVYGREKVLTSKKKSKYYKIINLIKGIFSDKDMVLIIFLSKMYTSSKAGTGAKFTVISKLLTVNT